MKRIAVVGAGVSGLGAAYALRCALPEHVEVTLFEADCRLGGHAHTVDVTLPNQAGEMVTHGVDTGFLVFNERTYPRLIALFNELNVSTVLSDMSFSVQVPKVTKKSSQNNSLAWMAGLEWNGRSLNSVFAQRSRLWSVPFWQMLVDIFRFNQLSTRMVLANEDVCKQETVQHFLDRNHFGQPFRDAYLLPMVACIWSCPVEQMMQFPISTLIQFCHNHGLLQVQNRPKWYTVNGGSRAYVNKLIHLYQKAGGQVRVGTSIKAIQRHALSDSISLPSGVGVVTSLGVENFDEVILACHSDQSLSLLADQASADERRVLGAIGYHSNRAILHTDTDLMPKNKNVWASWNYERAALNADNPHAVCLHYWINCLQPLPWNKAVMVSLNPIREPDPSKVLQTFQYAHPVFDHAAVQAQPLLNDLQGKKGLWFCGAWTGYGFHEDGLKSGQVVAAKIAAKIMNHGVVA